MLKIAFVGLPGSDLSVLVWSEQPQNSPASCDCTTAIIGYVTLAPRPQTDTRTIAQLRAAYTALFLQTSLPNLRLHPGQEDYGQIFALTDSVWARKTLNIVPILQPFWLAALGNPIMSCYGLIIFN